MAAIATTLSGAAGVSALVGSRVYRTRREQLPALPALQIEQQGGPSEQIVLGKSDVDLDVLITAYASNDTPDTGPDAVLAAAHAALFADRTLGIGSDVHVNASFAVESPQVDGFDYCALAHRYTVSIRTATASI